MQAEKLRQKYVGQASRAKHIEEGPHLFVAIKEKIDRLLAEGDDVAEPRDAAAYVRGLLHRWKGRRGEVGT